MKFTKLHGCGNDYLYIDCITNVPPANPEELARLMSDRHFGVGSDGLILICPPNHPGSHCRMETYNADGSRAALCGNGSLCATRLAARLGLAPAGGMVLRTDAGDLESRLRTGWNRAAAALDSGAAGQLLDRWVEVSGSLR